MRTRRFIPLAALPLVVMTAAPSHAAVTAFYAEGGYQVMSTAADSITITCVAGKVSPAPVGDANCADIQTIDVTPGEEADVVDLSAVSPTAFPAVTSVGVFAESETSNSVDTITGSAYDDRIYADFYDDVNGGPGNDRIENGGTVHGGPGNDVLWTSSGNGGNFGDDGDDRFVNALSQTANNGGAGDDSLEADFHQAAASLDFELTFTNAELILSVGGVEAANYPVVGFEHLVITLPEKGTQSFTAAAFPGDLDIRGFGGVDIITGSKRSDVLRGGTGGDIIEARDGVFDLVDCGLGTDTAKVDPIDKVVGCESITYAPPQTSAIKGPRNITQGKSGTFKFSSNVPGAVFQCKIDSRRWKACTSPYAVGTSTLSKGLHTLRVRAGYPKGNWDKTPSKKSFGVA